MNDEELRLSLDRLRKELETVVESTKKASTEYDLINAGAGVDNDAVIEFVYDLEEDITVLKEATENILYYFDEARAYYLKGR